MQVNRLSQLLFPPTAPTVTAGLLDADDTQAQGTATAAASRTHRTAAASQESESTPQAASEASVKLDLNNAQRTHAPATYGPDSLFAGKSRIEVANTPAERFVANAVDIMRAYEQEHAQPLTPGPFDRIKQAMSRFSAQA